MMVQEVHEEHRVECGLTQRVFESIPDNVLTFMPAIEQATALRSIGAIAWHIVQALPGIMNQAGMTLVPAEPKHWCPTSTQELVQAYSMRSEAFLSQLAQYRDVDLLSNVSIYGMNWTVAETLSVLRKHEIHHRGQLCLLLRIAGARVPEVYGPSADSKMIGR